MKSIKHYIAECLFGQGKIQQALEKYKETELLLHCNSDKHELLLNCR